MTEITIRELRNHGGRVVDRVAAGEQLVVTRDGTPVARLLPVDPTPMSSLALAQRWATLPAMDSELLGSDIDAVMDQSL